MVYIFTNAHTYSDKKEFGEVIKEKFKPEENDIVVSMNLCTPIDAAFDYFKQLKNDMKLKIYSVLRGMNIGNVESYWGLDFSARNFFLFHRVICLRPLNLSLKVLDSIDPKTNETEDLIPKINIDFYKEYCKDSEKDPTTGYFTYQIFKQLFPDEQLMLVNFYGDDNNSTPKSCQHNWELENSFFKESDKLKMFI